MTRILYFILSSTHLIVGSRGKFDNRVVGEGGNGGEAGR